MEAKFKVGDVVLVAVEDGRPFNAVVTAEAWTDAYGVFLYKVRDASRNGYIVKEVNLTKQDA